MPAENNKDELTKKEDYSNRLAVILYGASMSYPSAVNLQYYVEKMAEEIIRQREELEYWRVTYGEREARQ